MLHEANPDIPGEEQFAIADLMHVAIEAAQKFAGWERFSMTKKGHKLAFGKLPPNVKEMPLMIQNKIAQATTSLGWQIRDQEQNEIILQADDVKSRILLAFDPQPQIALVIKII